jgi:hypothetical protein
VSERSPQAPDPGREALVARASRPTARERSRKERGRGAVVAFLLANVIPAAAAVWFFTRPEEERQRLLDRIPSGVGSRTGVAVASFVVLLVLALVVLPGAKATVSALHRARGWFRTRPTGTRVALFPLEALTGLLWFLAQCVFAVDAVLILAAGAAFLLYVIRILKPEMFPWLPG